MGCHMSGMLAWEAAVQRDRNPSPPPSTIASRHGAIQNPLTTWSCLLLLPLLLLLLVVLLFRWLASPAAAGASAAACACAGCRSLPTMAACRCVHRCPLVCERWFYGGPAFERYHAVDLGGACGHTELGVTRARQSVSSPGFKPGSWLFMLGPHVKCFWIGLAHVLNCRPGLRLKAATSETGEQAVSCWPKLRCFRWRKAP